MTYYAGQNLAKRIKDYSLDDLWDRLAQYGAGKTGWQPYKVQPEFPEQNEQLRITIYSMLHQSGTKPLLRVKLVFNYLLIEEKVTRTGVKSGIAQISGYFQQDTEPGATETNILPADYFENPVLPPLDKK